MSQMHGGLGVTEPTEPMVVLPLTVEKRIQSLALPPDQEKVLREKMLASFDDGAVQRRIEKYFDVGGGGDSAAYPRWNLKDCDQGHMCDVVHERYCIHCARLLHDDCIRVSTDSIFPDSKLGEIRKDGLSVNGQVYRPRRGKAYIDVAIVQPVKSPPTSREDWIELERFRVYFEEP